MPAISLSAAQPLTGEAYVLQAHGPDSPRRSHIESFVQARFQRSHGAQVRTFMPTLLSLHDSGNALRGVVGSRMASSGPLFLERYLDRPIEQLLGAYAAEKVARHEIVEVGNFACTDSVAARELMKQLPWHLLREGAVWIVFTATDTVRGLLNILNAPLIELACADEACVRGGCDEWGAYYATDPRVMAGYLPNAYLLRHRA